MSSRSKLLLTTIVIATVITLSLFTIPTFAEPAGRIKVGDTLIISSLRAVAYRRIDNATVKVNASVTLMVEVTAERNNALRLEIKSGTIVINGAAYRVDMGKGLATPLRAGKGFIVLRGTAVEGAGGTVGFKFEGLLDIRRGNVVFVAKGPVKVGDILYGLRFLALVKRA